jgi:predicted O-methyltransferase YrrM
MKKIVLLLLLAFLMPVKAKPEAVTHLESLSPRKVARRHFKRLYNGVVHRLHRSSPVNPGLPQLREIYDRARLGMAISDHLPTLFAEALAMKPATIVELGVRGGESTYVFGRIGQLLPSTTIVSIDIKNCKPLQPYNNWHFVRDDDIQFAGKFVDFCSQRGIKSAIDLLFIDTSHLYEHTLKEIERWFPLLADHTKVIFHDTNMHRVYFRKDHSIGYGWDNERGVIKAIEDYFGTRFNESVDFVDFLKGWLIKHYAHSSGLTILERLLKE